MIDGTNENNREYVQKELSTKDSIVMSLPI